MEGFSILTSCLSRESEDSTRTSRKSRTSCKTRVTFGSIGTSRECGILVK